MALYLETMPQRSTLVLVDRYSRLVALLSARNEEHEPDMPELLREISQRLRVFNQRYIQEILQTERLTIVGRFARSIVHDLKNPLNIIGLTAEMYCLDSATAESRQKSASTIRKQIERVSDMISEIALCTALRRVMVKTAPPNTITAKM